MDSLPEMLGKRPRVLALGEPTHRENDLLRLRNEVFRELVEVDGYRTIALESDCLAGLLVDDYVTSSVGELDEVMAHGFSHGWGDLAGNRELVEWMRDFNQGRSDQVRFAGFDGPLEISAAASPRYVLRELQKCLGVEVEGVEDLLGPDEQWTNEAIMYDASQSVGRTPEAEQLQLIAGRLAALVETQTPTLTDWRRARLYARTAVGLLEYHYWMADPSDQRIARLLAQRDVMMAGNLLALADRGPTFVYAHNAHLQREKSSLHMAGANHGWWSAGALVDTHLGHDYAFFATAVGTIRHHDVPTPPEDTIEGVLYQQDRQLIDPSTLPDSLQPRVSPWFGYAALHPDHLPSIDGIVFVKDLTPSA